jgi:hypothetical protein
MAIISLEVAETSHTLPPYNVKVLFWSQYWGCWCKGFRTGTDASGELWKSDEHAGYVRNVTHYVAYFPFNMDPNS